MSHWKWFAEFCKYEQMTGGPDPHMKAVLKICEGLPREEQLWRSFLYVAVYNVPSAEAIWRTLSAEEFIHKSDYHGIRDFLEVNWKGIRLRRERRTVKSPEKLATCLWGFHQIVKNLPDFEAAPFEDVWQFALSLPHFGRYAATKITEIWPRLGFVRAEVPDIRPKGGWSPRSAIALMYPEMNHDPYDNSGYSQDQANELAADIYLATKRDYGVKLSWFELEVLLCEYKSSYSSRRQYPGRSLDSELTYERAILDYWYAKGSEHSEGVTTDHMRVRQLLSPDWALGEVQGWNGVREELGHVLRDHGYTWSDSLYDYRATTDFSNPVRKETP